MSQLVKLDGFAVKNGKAEITLTGDLGAVFAAFSKEGIDKGFTFEVTTSTSCSACGKPIHLSEVYKDPDSDYRSYHKDCLDNTLAFQTILAKKDAEDRAWFFPYEAILAKLTMTSWTWATWKKDNEIRAGLDDAPWDADAVDIQLSSYAADCIA